MTSPSCEYPASSAYQAYTTIVEAFRRVAYDPSRRLWFVWEPDGIKTTYAPELTRGAGSDSSSTYSWHIEQVQDPLGNHVTYLYRSVDFQGSHNAAYPSAILYNRVEIHFYYEERPDTVLAGIGDHLSETRLRLKTIDISVGDHRARAYALRYIKSPSTSRSILSEVQQYGTDAVLNAETITAGTAYPPIKVQYDAERREKSWAVRRYVSPDQAPGGEATTLPNVFPDPTQLVDRSWSKAFHAGDFDGDGRSDGLLATFTGGTDGATTVHFATFFADGTTSSSSLELPPHSVAYSWAADLDGDGRSDLIFGIPVPVDSSQPAGPFFIELIGALSLGNGLFQLGPRLKETSWLDYLDPSWAAQCQPGDVNGDRRADLVCIYADGSGKHFIGTAYSRGDGSFYGISSMPAPLTLGLGTRSMAVADTNGDGLADVEILDFAVPTGMCPGTDCPMRYDLVTAISSGDGDYRLQRTRTEWQVGEYRASLYAADLNGDGRADYLSFAGAATDEQNRLLGSIQTATTGPDGSLSLNTQPISSALLDQPDIATVGDVNGDGRTDLLLMTPLEPGTGVGCSQALNNFRHPLLTRVLSNGDGTFQLPARWDDCRTSTEVGRPWSEITAASDVEAADTNGDGLADFLMSFVGDVGSEHSVTVHDDVSPKTRLDTGNWIPADVNGDGRQDLLYMSGEPTATSLYELLQQPDASYKQVTATLPHWANGALRT